MKPENKVPRESWLTALAIFALILLLPLVVVVLLCFLASTALLRILVQFFWLAKGKDVLLVYSDSPIWHDYVEIHLLPPIEERAIVLNWSERKRWKPSLARWVFFHYGGGREFNPLGVTFRPWRRARVFRFWEPFRDYKHGKTAALEKMQRAFFESLGVRS